MKRGAKQHGFILMPVIIAIVLIATIAFMLNNQSAINVNQTGGLLQAERVEQVAQAGLAHATWAAQNSGCAGDVGVTTVPFGQDGIGSYTTMIDTPATTASQYTFNPDQDANIQESSPAANDGAATELKVKEKTGSGQRRALVHYDLSTIPAGARVVSATAWFYQTLSTNVSPVNIHPVTTAWTEAAATWDNIGSSYDSQVFGVLPQQSAAGVWIPVNFTALTQSWVNDASTNYGIMLIGTPDDLAAQFSSREYGTANLRPYLEITTADASVSPVKISATGTLTGNPSPANDISRKLARSNVTAYQPDSNLVLQPDAATGEDAYIWEWTKTTNYGADAETWVSLANNSTSRSLFRFNLAGVPVGAKIVSATLSLHHQSGNNADVPITAHRISNPWNEAFVTWNQRDNGINWNAAGGDFDAAVISTTAVGPASDVRYEWDITRLVQGWTDSDYPNYGVALATARSNSIGERFYTSDETIVTRRPRLTVQYTCECGSSCLVPQGSGTVMLVVINPTTLVPVDAYKKALFESWGYTVNVMGENSNVADYVAASDSNDVFYISETVNVSQVGVRIKDVPIGVVSEDGNYNDNLGFATGSAYTVGSALNVTDTSHYITALFPTGPLDIYTAGMEQLTVSGGAAPGLQQLADSSGAGSLVVLDEGAALGGGGSAAGRRVMLPLGREGKFNWDYLNGNGRLIVQRALQWGTSNLGGTPPPGLLLVVGNDGGLTTEETAHKTLVESWGYVVELIDDDASQANFDTAVAANDVAFITEGITASSLGTKLVNATIGVVTSEDNLSDEFGMAASIAWESGTVVEINDNTHYITSPFPTGLLTVFSASNSLAYVTGTLSPELAKLASSTSGFGIVTLDAGAARHDVGNSAGRRVQLPWGGNGFDPNDFNDDGRTILQRALEWGTGANLPVVPKQLLLVVTDPGTVTAQEQLRIDLIVSWGYVVNLIDDDDSEANFDAAVVSNDVAYVSSTVSDSALGKKLKPATIGVVNENMELAKVFGFGNDYQTKSRDEIRVLAFDHYITEPLAVGYLPIFTSLQSVFQRSSSSFTMDKLADSYNTGTDSNNKPSLLTINSGTVLEGGGTAAGRRVQLPWGSNTFDVAALNADGQTIMQRAIEWGAGVGLTTPPGYRDEFNAATCDAAVDYAGSDGLVDWSGWQWNEVNETDGPCAGQVQIGVDPLIADPGSNRLIVTGTGVRMQRQLDLSGFTSPALSFDYRLVNYPLDDFMRIRISTDGGFNWTELDRYEGPFNHSTYQSASYDISAFIDVDTLISFEFNGISSTRVSYIDNVHVQEGGGGGGGGGNICDSSGNYLDQFEVYQFDNSDGSIDWSTSPWQEVGESDGPTAGDIRIWTDLSSIRIRTRDKNRGLEREADLTGAATASLTYDYRRDSLDGSSDYSTVEVSANGVAGPWTELARYQGAGTDSAYLSGSHDISSFINSNTRIRLKTSTNMGKNDIVWFDNIEITCAP